MLIFQPYNTLEEFPFNLKKSAFIRQQAGSRLITKWITGGGKQGKVVFFFFSVLHAIIQSDIPTGFRTGLRGHYCLYLLYIREHFLKSLPFVRPLLEQRRDKRGEKESKTGGVKQRSSLLKHVQRWRSWRNEIRREDEEKAAHFSSVFSFLQWYTRDKHFWHRLSVYPQ